ncbi:MAG: aspartate/glutamate racemase family protein [Amylibacter sp.]|jgi:maleate isomerase|nr:aspartate/glutamate racemase family protein [Amylibacter sp.]
MAQAFETDQGYGGQTVLGLIVLTTDETIEPELASVFTPSRVPVYHSRIAFEEEVTPETLGRMEQDLPASARMLSKGLNYGAIGYGCTSGATVIGADRIAELVNGVHPDTPVTNPITAVIAACKALKAKKIGFLTPYVADVSAMMRGVLEREGFEIAEFLSFEEIRDSVVARITEKSTLDAVKQLGQSDCDVVFTSCTNLRAFGIIEEAEAAIGKPVISSNSALAWHMAHLAGLDVDGPGRLFSV